MPTLFDSSAPAKKTKTPMPPRGSYQHSTMTPLTSFALAPEGVRFETQKVQEEVIIFLRQHLIVNLPWVLISLLLLIAPWLIFPFAWRFLRLPFILPFGYVIIGTLFWYVFTFGFILANFLRWFFNIYIVTNERVVDIDFVQLLYKQFSEARLAKIQDLSYKTSGLLAALFNYGDVSIQTAGELPNFEFEAVPRPESVVQTIGELTEKARSEI